MRIIRRYANRKFYDTEQSGYVTLPDLAKTIRDGIEMRVVNYETDKDITSTILCEILLDQVRRGMPATVAGLRRIIVSGLPVE